MRIWSVSIALAFIFVGWSQPTFAQTIQLNFEAKELRAALVQFESQERVNIVYADRQVLNRTSTCRYRGNSIDEALACVLGGNGLKAQRVRRRQYVLATVSEDEQKDPARANNVITKTLLGFVKDAETDEVLIGAHIYLPALQLGTTTNKAGYFALPSLPPESYHVRFSYLGYVTQDTLVAAQDSTLMVTLSPVALETEGVVVEANRADLSVDPGVVNIPVQELERLPSFPGEQDLFQALQWLPGVRKSGEVNGGLVIRGGEPDQNLYLIDGAPVYHPWHAFSLISTFQTETFKDIKLYRGSFPAEHGGRLSSVLDAELKDGSRAEPVAIAAIGVPSARFIIETPVAHGVSFMVSGRRTYLDKIIPTRHPVSEGGVRDTLRTGYVFYDLSSKISWRAGQRHRLSLSYYNGRDDLDLRLPFELSLNFNDWLKPAGLFFEVDQRWGNRLVSARYQYLYSRRFFVTATAYNSSYKADERALIRPTDASLVASKYEVRLRDLGLKVDFDYYASLAHQIRFGVTAVQRGFRSLLDARVQRSPGSVDSLDQQSRLESVEWVAYIQDSWQPSPRWHIQPGLRASFFSSGTYARLSPRLSARYAIDPERLIVRAAAGVQVQYLHRLRDRFSLLYDLVSSRWVPASSTAHPSKSLQFGAGVELHPRHWLTIALDGYWRTTDHILLPEDEFQSKDGLEGPGIEVGTLLGQYVTGQGKAYGLEASTRVERGPWTYWVNYTGSRSLVRTGEETAAFRPARFDIPRAFKSVISRNGRHWSFSFSTDWRTGYPYTVPVARYAIGDPLDDQPVRYLYRPDLNNGRLPAYLRFDVVVGYRFSVLGADLRTQLYLYNVTNRRNVIDRLYNPQDEQAVVVSDRRGLPFLPLFELRLEL